MRMYGSLQCVLSHLHLCCILARSTFADRTANSLKLVGDTPWWPLHAAESYPEDALRVFMRKHHRTYTDERPVGSADPAEHELIEVCVSATPGICQILNHLPLSACPQEAVEAETGIAKMPGSSAHCSALKQEFPERLRIFKETAKGIREENALIKKRKGEGAKVRFLPTVALLEC